MLQADTYDSTAVTHDEAACAFAIVGCQDSAALNYFASANTAPSAESELACDYPIVGCTIPSGTLNFDSNAVVLSGCVLVAEGCTDSGALCKAPCIGVRTWTWTWTWCAGVALMA